LRTRKRGSLGSGFKGRRAVGHEIGIQDVSAIVVTIAVINAQGLIYVKKTAKDLKNFAVQLPDYVNGSDLADFLNPAKSTGWAYQLLPNGSAASPFSIATGMPQSMVSQIRIYQRYFYINNS
jgi:hypothetical protein